MPSDSEVLRLAEPLQPEVTPADKPLLNFMGRLQYDEAVPQHVRAYAGKVRGFFNLKWASLMTLEHEQALVARAYVEDALSPLALQFTGVDAAEMVLEAVDLVHNRAIQRAIAHQQMLNDLNLPTTVLLQLADSPLHTDADIAKDITTRVEKERDLDTQTAILQESGLLIRFQIVEEERKLLRVLIGSSETAAGTPAPRRGWLKPWVLIKKAMGNRGQNA